LNNVLILFILFYPVLVEEGRHRDRVRLQDGTFVDDIAMALLLAEK
jgi:hypothetical protein